MVTEPVKNRGGLWEFSILADADNRIVVDNYTASEGAELDVEAMRRAIARLYERGRADGAAAERERQEAQPRDLAGRIRALVQDCVGRLADSDDFDLDEALMEAMERVVYMASCVRRGTPIGPHIELMREAYTSAKGREVLGKIADELEAIVRECAAKDGGT